MGNQDGCLLHFVTNQVAGEVKKGFVKLRWWCRAWLFRRIGALQLHVGLSVGTSRREGGRQLQEKQVLQARQGSRDTLASSSSCPQWLITTVYLSSSGWIKLPSIKSADSCLTGQRHCSPTQSIRRGSLPLGDGIGKRGPLTIGGWDHKKGGPFLSS